MAFDDEPGAAAVEWEHLPPEREFFATPYDPPVKALVQEMRDEELIVRPTFQRYGVWDAVRQSKFVESVLLNIPIPNLFFAEDDEHKKVVVDGQQRLTALRNFLDNRLELKKLEVLAPLNGKRCDELTERQQRIIKNRTLRCLVISAKSDSEIRFQVFERLNQGGIPLNAQEVRHCVYRGALNDLLHSLAREQQWLQVLGSTSPHPRMSDCELILRYFALRATLPTYSPPLKTLLNSFTRANRHAPAHDIDALRAAFFSSLVPVAKVFGQQAFRRLTITNGEVSADKAINRAVFDAQMLMMDGLNIAWATENAGDVRRAFATLCASTEFADAITKATADRSHLRVRLQLWRDRLVGMGAHVACSTRADIPL
jgi:hypothetical protein